jgi:hypothetical protein
MKPEPLHRIRRQERGFKSTANTGKACREYVELPIASPVVAASSRMAFDSTPVIVDHHEFLPLEDEPDDAKGYSGYE